MAHTALTTLIELANQRQQDSLCKLGKAQQVLHQDQQKLQLLQQYRINYQSEMLQALQRGLTSGQLGNQQNFLQKIDDAIVQQQKICQHRIQNKMQSANRWQNDYRHINALNTLQSRRQAEQIKKEKKQQQRLTDEWAARIQAISKQANLIASH